MADIKKFTRSAVREILPNATDEELTALMDLHHAVFDPVKDALDISEKEVKRLTPMEQELSTLRQEDYKAKYEDANNKLTALQAEKDKSATMTALKEALKEGGFADKYLDTVANVLMAQGAAKLGTDGKIADAKKLVDEAKETYSGFVTQTRTVSAQVDHPPKNDAAMTAEAWRNMSLDDRIKLKAENPEAYAAYKKL